MENNHRNPPLPIVETGSLEFPTHLFEEGEPTPYTPFGTAVLWHIALGDVEHNRNALDALSLHPEVWGDYAEASSLLRDMSLLSNVVDNPEDDCIKYVRFIDYAGKTNGQAFESAELDSYRSLTVVNPEGSPCWFVWGISDDGYHSREQVRGI